MGVLDRLRDWLGGLTGGTDDGSTMDGAAPEPSADATEPADDGDDADDADRGPDAEADEGLDPAAVTETRSAAMDEAVEALRDVRTSAADPAGDEDGKDPSAGGENGSSAGDADDWVAGDGGGPSADDEATDHTNS